MKKRKKKAYFRESGIYISLVENKRLLCYAFIWGIPFAVSCVLGWRLVNAGTVFGSGGSTAAFAGSFILFLMETAILSVPSSGFAALVLCGGKRRGMRSGSATTEKTGESGKTACTATEKTGESGQTACTATEKTGESGQTACAAAENSERLCPAWQVWLFYSLLILLCWLPVFLAYYPSVFAYDAEGQLYQVIAKDYSTHHPLLHTLFLGAFFKLGGALGSYQTGMAVHSVVQMLLMALAFGRALVWLHKEKTPHWIELMLLLFYGLFPANSILALSTTKDVLFSVLVLLCTLKLYRLVSDRSLRVERAGAGDWVAFVGLACLTLLFRNNAVYAFAVSIPIVYIGLWERKRRTGGSVQEAEARRGGADGMTFQVRDGRTGGAAKRKWLIAATAVLLSFGLSSLLLKAVTHAENGSPREMLSVPLQQMARVRVLAEEQIDPAMRQELDKYIPAEWVFAAYNPHLADPVKNRAVIHDDPAGLIKVWMKLGMQFPTIYTDAFLDNSLGMWYLWDTSHAEIYGIGTESGFGYLSTDNRIMPAGCEIVERSFLPGLRAFMEHVVSDNAYQKLPFVRLLFAPALYWWLLWLYLAAAMYHRKNREALPAVFLIAYYLTLLLSPTVIVRYLYPLMVTVPVILPCLLAARTGEKYENVQ